LRMAGAESNFAIAAARLGLEVTWMSRLGTDDFGEIILGTLQDEGIDVTYVCRDSARPTGVFFKVRTRGKTRVIYYRRGSAASALAPGDLPEEAFAGIGVLHLTGITMALSASAREFVVDVVRRGRAHGAVLTF
jgi:2-dehydro-3-deoxygluconokinase